jgi:glutamate-1-semialdehyde 2,1-aminomutase
VLILDDVRAGFRLHPKGSHKAMGLIPDMLCLGKALGNGHAIAALMGTEPMRRGVECILYTSTYLFGAASCEAGIAVLDVYERDNAFAKMQRAGERLIAGIQKAATAYGQKISFSGPSTQPTMLYDDDPDLVLMERFCYEAAKRDAARRRGGSSLLGLLAAGAQQRGLLVPGDIMRSQGRQTSYLL